MKFCTDCKNFLHSMCTFPSGNENTRDVVTGFPIGWAQPPILMRSNEAYCGGEGKWFEYRREER